MPKPRKKLSRPEPRTQPARFQGRNAGLAFSAPVEIQAAAESASGLRTFRIVAYTGEPMRLCWWDEPVVIDLATLQLAAQRIPVLYDHCADVDFVLGQTDRVAVEGTQIVASGAIIEPTEDGGERQRIAGRVLKLAAAGFVWQASVGGNAGTREFVPADVKTTVNGREYQGPLYVVHGASLQEISFVVNGADQFTEVMVARKLRGAAMPTFEDFVMSLGLDPAALTDQQRAAITMLYKEKYPDEAEEPVAAEGADEEVEAAEEESVPTDDQAAVAQARGRRGNVRASGRTGSRVQRLRQEAAAEVTRQDEVRLVCTSYPADLEVEVTEGSRRRRVKLLAHALAEGWSRDQTELAALRASRPQGGGVISRSHDRDCTADALSAALILRAGGRLDNPHYRQSPATIALRLPAWLRAGVNDDGRSRIMEAAHHYSGMSAIDICREACRLDGRDAPSDRYDLIRAASSGSALTNIFTTNVNAILLATYLEAPDTTSGWVSETDVADFKTQERPRVNIGSGLAKLPRGGEADHANYADSVESYKIARYAKQFQVDEQDIIDDMLDALSGVPTDMGRAAARLRPDLVYAILLDNPTLSATDLALFDANQDQGTNKGNLPSGAALSASALRTGVQRMGLFRENSVNLNLAPTHLLVGPSNRHLAYELTQSSQILVSTGNTSGTERGDLNALRADSLTPISDARLENGVTDPSTGDSESGSTTAWFLVCNWAHTIEVGYLRGTGRAPQVRSFVLDKGKWGIGWDIKFDIGAKALDWKGLLKNAGA